MDRRTGQKLEFRKSRVYSEIPHCPHLHPGKTGRTSLECRLERVDVKLMPEWGNDDDEYPVFDVFIRGDKIKESRISPPWPLPTSESKRFDDLHDLWLRKQTIPICSRLGSAGQPVIAKCVTSGWLKSEVYDHEFAFFTFYVGSEEA